MREGWMSDARQPTPENLEIAEHVVETLQAWESGEMPLEEARRLSSGWEKFVAVCHVQGEGRELLMRFLDIAVADQCSKTGDVITPTGLIPASDIQTWGGIVRVVDGRRVVVWPATIPGVH